MKTAMEELIDDIKNELAVSIKTPNPYMRAAAELAIKRTTEAILEQAQSKIEKEQQQIEKAFQEGWSTPHGERCAQSGSEYYNETYKAT